MGWVSTLLLMGKSTNIQVSYTSALFGCFFCVFELALLLKVIQ